MRAIVWFLTITLFITAFITACNSMPSLPRLPEDTLDVQNFGSAHFDSAFGMAALTNGAGAVVVGYTEGDLHGVNKGGHDSFVRKYDSSLVWGRQFGTSYDDLATDVVLYDNGVSYVLGTTKGALVSQIGKKMSS
ncbi:MAG: hypothetical protein R2865_15450 [Deinococcales bacterium]